MSADAEQLRYLEWDSSHFHFPIAAYHWKGDSHGLEGIVRRARHERFTLLYVYAQSNIDIPESVRPLCDDVFTSARVEFCKALGTVGLSQRRPKPEPCIVPLKPDENDLPALRKLGILAGTYSRFVRDPRFPRDLAQELFGLWAENSVAGKMADIVFGLRLENRQLRGFVTVCKEEKGGRIGLIAVDPSAGRKGYGRLLLTAAETWMYTLGLATAYVTTQADNRIALALYSNSGYREKARENVFHLWLAK